MSDDRSSHGRHGGNSGRTDKGEAETEHRTAGVNTDVDSLRQGRDRDQTQGHTSGKK